MRYSNEKKIKIFRRVALSNNYPLLSYVIVYKTKL